MHLICVIVFVAALFILFLWKNLTTMFIGDALFFKKHFYYVLSFIIYGTILQLNKHREDGNSHSIEIQIFFRCMLK